MPKILDTRETFGVERVTCRCPAYGPDRPCSRDVDAEDLLCSLCRGGCSTAWVAARGEDGVWRPTRTVADHVLAWADVRLEYERHLIGRDALLANLRANGYDELVARVNLSNDVDVS